MSVKTSLTTVLMISPVWKMSLWVAAVDFLRYCLVDGDGQNHLARRLVSLYLFYQPRVFLKGILLQLFRLDVVERKGDLLVLVVLVEVVDGKVVLLLGFHHALHQFYGRVVLPAVAFAMCLDSYHTDFLVVGFQGDVEVCFCLAVDGHDAWLVAQGAEGDVPSLMAGNGILSAETGDGRHLMPFIHHAGIGDAVACLGIGDDTGDGLCLTRHGQEQQQYQKVQKRLLHIIGVNLRNILGVNLRI